MTQSPLVTSSRSKGIKTYSSTGPRLHVTHTYTRHRRYECGALSIYMSYTLLFFFWWVWRLFTLIWLAVIVVIRRSAPLFRSWWHRCVLNYVYVSGNDYETNLSRWMLHFKWKLNWNERVARVSSCVCVSLRLCVRFCISEMEKTANSSKIEREHK